MEKRVTLKVLFYIKRTKLLKNGEAPIYMRLSINRTKTELAINRSINPDLWSSEKGAAKGSGKEARFLNNYLESIRYNLMDLLSDMREKKMEVTARRIKDEFLGIREEERTILSVFRDFIKKAESLIGIDYTEGTIQHYRTTGNYLIKYLKSQYKRDDMPLIEVDHKFVVDLEVYLKTVAGISHNTVMKYMKKLKKVIREAIANGWILKDPFAGYKITEKKVDRDFLTPSELKSIVDHDFELDRLAQVKDCFLFSCFTGLAHSDLRKLSYDNLVTGTDGNQWISIKRQKTKVESRIPLLPVVSHIIEKYKGHPICIAENRLLPVSSNQRMNAYLKEIATICGIKKHLTSHIARHTFATTVTLNNDIPFESVSKMLGHTSFKTTRIYARLLDNKVGQDMNKLNQVYH